METPIIDLLEKYAGAGTLRCHMPGHKGCRRKAVGEVFPLDITEIKGADSLFEASGIIRRSEQLISGLYGTADTLFSAGGSTLCIQGMLAAMKLTGRHVIAARNVHRAFLNAAALLDIQPEWLMPEYSGSLLTGEISPERAEEMLCKQKDPACLYVTSPDYTGKCADIKALAEVCHRHGALLIVDNAHGAHLHFFPESRHPIALGADMCCDSAHKMLPALTGGAFLHTARPELAGLLRQGMSMFGSTSPSYLIMGSLELCGEYIEEEIRRDILRRLPLISGLKESFSGRLKFAEGEPFHITVKAAESGFDGDELGELLRKSGVECEYSDRELLILLMSPVSPEEDFTRLQKALERALSQAKRRKASTEPFAMELPQKAMTIRQAALSPCREIPVEEAQGRICASVKVPCPPAIPIAASGEVISAETINIFKRYGISSVIVVE